MSGLTTQQALAQKRVKELFDYADGKLVWRVRPHGRSRARAGDVAGCLTPDGRRVVGFNKQQFLLHRLIFLWHHGFFPALIDHIDGDRTNNRIENLREASLSENAHNAKITARNTSGIKGVYFMKRRGVWGAQLMVRRKPIWLGSYEDRELAKLVVMEARELYHGRFARHA